MRRGLEVGRGSPEAPSRVLVALKKNAGRPKKASLNQYDQQRLPGKTVEYAYDVHTYMYPSCIEVESGMYILVCREYYKHAPLDTLSTIGSRSTCIRMYDRHISDVSCVYVPCVFRPASLRPSWFRNI